MEERVFSLFQNESYKEKFPYINVKESGNIFWQCDLIEAIIYNSEIVKDDLNIFERTILKMIDYHGYSSKELSEIICIEEDLVEYLIKKILEYNAKSVILVHNHPAGSLKPSDSDILLTKKVKEVFESMEIRLLDHLIISEQGYFSFLEGGIL